VAFIFMDRMPFVNRRRELAALSHALPRGLLVVYGRRRLGKSTLIRELLRGRPHTAYVGDDRQAPVQRAALAREISDSIPGFSDVAYPDWESLLRRWWREAPPETCLVLDELPSIVRTSPELPSLLQKLHDAEPRSLVVCGSSQRMMYGMFLDASSPLFGRATAIVRVEPMSPGTLAGALGLAGEEAVEAWAVWGGVPRYWELARGLPLWTAIRDLVLDPLGVLHREPDRLLSDELDELSRATSLLAVVAQGAHRASEIGARLETSANGLQRPLGLLIELGLLQREVPFGRTLKETRRTAYRIADPFVAFWFRFVDANRTALDGGGTDAVLARVRRDWPMYVGGWWEELVRRGIGRTAVAGESWMPAARWWGPSGSSELDAVAEADDDPRRVLVVEVKRNVRAHEVDTLRAGLLARARACPELAGRSIVPRIAALHGPADLGPADFLRDT
jgi:uncharacterized protein